MNDYDKAMKINELLEARIDVLCQIELSEGGNKDFWKYELKNLYKTLDELGWKK